MQKEILKAKLGLNALSIVPNGTAHKGRLKL